MKFEDIKVVAVIGAGLMGNGIAQVSAAAGYKVFMRDIDTKFVDNGLASIKKSLGRIVKKERITQEQADEIFSRITGTVDLSEAIKEADIIIEAITENPEIKNKTWKEIGENAKPEAILASNTSSISITAMGTASNRAENFLGLHFFNPVPMMKLLEIIRGQLTSDETYETAKKFGEKVGKTTITVNEAPGFAVNRVLIPFMLEVIRAIEQGVCTPEDMDTGCKLGLNHPMGPITLLDFVGLDTTLFIADYMFDETGDPKFKAPNLLRKMVRAGLYGRKSGRGFYKY
ncbi:MAG: 3-hydroxyacyl-CoA dehydrogenase family protein [Candidatus Hodarchaeales archaeon]|jgi:3-hydroxybutyryl-CoA dehydrogenase